MPDEFAQFLAKQNKSLDVDTQRRAIEKGASDLGVDPEDYATAISYESARTFDPWAKGPVTKWGQHRGTIQYGEPQRKEFGVFEGQSFEDQVTNSNVKYLRKKGVKPGMKFAQIYKAINAGDINADENTPDANTGRTVGDNIRNAERDHREFVRQRFWGGKKPLDEFSKFVSQNQQPDEFATFLATQTPGKPVSVAPPPDNYGSGAAEAQSQITPQVLPTSPESINDRYAITGPGIQEQFPGSGRETIPTTPQPKKQAPAPATQPKSGTVTVSAEVGAPVSDDSRVTEQPKNWKAGDHTATDEEILGRDDVFTVNLKGVPKDQRGDVQQQQLASYLNKKYGIPIEKVYEYNLRQTHVGADDETEITIPRKVLAEMGADVVGKYREKEKSRLFDTYEKKRDALQKAKLDEIPDVTLKAAITPEELSLALETAGRQVGGSVGAQAGSVAGGELGSSGRIAGTIGGILDFVNDLSPTKGESMAKALDPHVRVARPDDSFRDILRDVEEAGAKAEEKMGDKGMVSQIVKVAGATPGDLSRLVLLSRLPGGMISGMALDSAAQTKARGGDTKEILKSAGHGATLGALFHFAPAVGKGADTVAGTLFNNAGNVLLKEGATLATIGGGTYALARATGSDPETAFREAIVNSAFHLTNVAPQLLGKPIRVRDEKGNIATVKVEKNGDVKPVEAEPLAEVIVPEKAKPPVKSVETLKTLNEIPAVKTETPQPNAPALPKSLSSDALVDYLIKTDDAKERYEKSPDERAEFEQSLRDELGGSTAALKLISLDGLRPNKGAVDQGMVEHYSTLSTDAPPIVVRGNEVFEGNHRVAAARAKGVNEVWAYVVDNPSSKPKIKQGEILEQKAERNTPVSETQAQKTEPPQINEESTAKMNNADAPPKTDVGSVDEIKTERDSVIPSEPLKAGDEVFTKNKVFTVDKIAEAREVLRKKGTQFNTGIDPESFKALGTIGAGYIEAGARKFADFSKRMIEEFGEGVRKHLGELYGKIQEEHAFEGMEKGVSAVGKSIEAKTIEAGLAPLKETAEYEKVNIKDQAEKAAKMLSDMNKVNNILDGAEPLPEGLKGASAIKAIEDHALRTKDAELLQKLAKSDLISETSQHAQEMRLLRERDPDSATAQLQALKKSREEAAQKRLGKRTLNEAKKQEVGKIKESIKRSASKRPDWGQFIKEITCGY